MFMMYLDLDELPELFSRRWLWSTTRPALARFRRNDHLGASDEPLSDSIRDLVERETGVRPAGPIRLLTNLSYFGYCFNPVSFYYCFAEDGQTLQTIVAEVNNTPWGERDTYVLPDSMDVGNRGVKRFRPKKKMHVSPFMPMDVEYDWCFTDPAERLSVYMANSNAGKRMFDASINLTRTDSGFGLSGVRYTRIPTSGRRSRRRHNEVSFHQLPEIPRSKPETDGAGGNRTAYSACAAWILAQRAGRHQRARQPRNFRRGDRRPASDGPPEYS
jgi:DUF1365 family protein